MPSATAGPPTKTLIHPCAKLRSSSIRPLAKTTHLVSGGNMFEAKEAKEGDQGASSASSQHMVELPYHLPYEYKYNI